ncbi:hypothetical protein, conserved [Plasmodium vivax]|uniref:Vir protein n=1 Tax=Plasmodium vivax TaxID=5855 RepID=A0A1G4E4Y4_PLAVI|nr:hypothetical protein, conserved [Plasmodium vivax]
MNKFEKLECKPKAKPTEARSDNADTKLTPTHTYLEEQQEDEIKGDAMPEIDLENPESLSLQIDLNEDHTQTDTQPKLDTTYAAASLAGISLFGTILYKYGPSGFWLYPRRGASIRSKVFPLGNNLYDASTMDNFEYLQTGIPNGQYRVGYGSVTH